MWKYKKRLCPVYYIHKSERVNNSKSKESQNVLVLKKENDFKVRRYNKHLKYVFYWKKNLNNHKHFKLKIETQKYYNLIQMNSLQNGTSQPVF